MTADVQVVARSPKQQLLVRLDGQLVHKEMGSDGRIYLNAKDSEGRTIAVTIRAELLELVPAAEVPNEEIRRRLLEVPDRVVARHQL
jgi:hypothetical protein